MLVLTINRQRRSGEAAGRQSGVTLVELLVAMGLSVFLMAAVVQSFLGSRQSADVVQAQARMQENARFAYYFLARSIRMAGYPSALIEPNNMPDVTLVRSEWRASNAPALASFASFAPEAVVWGENDTSAVVTDAKPSSDIVHVRLQGMADGSVADCQGRAIAEGDWAQLSFYIDADQNFRCRSDDGAGGGGSVQNEILVEGIEEMQAIYGMNGGIGVANWGDYDDPAQVVRYANADSIAADEWTFVSTVKLALVSASDNAPLSPDGPARDYQLLDFLTSGYTDGKARQQFAQTIRIRNQNWNTHD